LNLRPLPPDEALAETIEKRIERELLARREKREGRGGDVHRCACAGRPARLGVGLL
jgi:hypothetical protein